MKVEEKYESLDNAIKTLDNFPIALTVTEAERKQIGLWVSKALAVAYDKGFQDGKNSR